MLFQITMDSSSLRYQYSAVVCLINCRNHTDLNLVRSWFKKCFFESFFTTATHRLASLGWNGGQRQMSERNQR